MTFQINDVVQTKGGKFRGILVDIADGVAYIEMRNGVEIDYPLTDIEYPPPDIAIKTDDVTPDTEEEIALYERVPGIMKLAAAAYYNRFPFRMADFNEQPIRIRLNVISALFLR